MVLGIREMLGMPLLPIIIRESTVATLLIWTLAVTTWAVAAERTGKTAGAAWTGHKASSLRPGLYHPPLSPLSSTCHLQPTAMKSPLISSQTYQPATGWWLLPALCVTCTLLLCLAPQASEARPAYESWSVYRAALTGSNSRRTNECELSGEVKTLCQQCAKVTRSNLVYPMCCTDREEARPWCSDYVNFGI